MSKEQKAIEVLSDVLTEGFTIGDRVFGLGDEEEQAINTAIEALKKRIPAKVEEIHVDEYYCPACGAENNADQGKAPDDFCPCCGQALDSEGAEDPAEE